MDLRAVQLPDFGRCGIYFLPFWLYNASMATLLLLVIYLVFISLGIPDALLGAAWPVAYAQLGVPVSYAGLTSVFITLGTVVSSLVAVSVVRRFGTGRVTLWSVLLTAAALMGVSLSRSYAALCLLSIPLGLGAGSIDAALNHYVANHYSALQMNLLHAFWGIGATGGPLLMAAMLVKTGDWHGGYRAAAWIQLALAAVAFAALPLWKRLGNAPSFPSAGGGTRLLGNREGLGTPGVKLGMLAFFCYCALEQSTGLWAATYFVSARGVAASEAAGYGSLFFAGVMAGRVLSGFASLKLGEKTLIRIGMLVSLAGALWMLALPMPAGVAGPLLVGLGCAPIFPNMLQLTPRHFGAAASQAAMGLQMASAYVGSTLVPPLFGLVGERLGFALLPWFLLLLLGALFCITERLNRYQAAALTGAA